MAEDPKRFLREIKAGIGTSRCGGDWQEIEFKDAQDRACRVACRGGELVLMTTEGADYIVLTPGQAKRMANTLERWAFAGNLGSAEPGEAEPAEEGVR